MSDYVTPGEIRAEIFAQCDTRNMSCWELLILMAGDDKDAQLLTAAIEPIVGTVAELVRAGRAAVFYQRAGGDHVAVVFEPAKLRRDLAHYVTPDATTPTLETVLADASDIYWIGLKDGAARQRDNVSGASSVHAKYLFDSKDLIRYARPAAVTPPYEARMVTIPPGIRTLAELSGVLAVALDFPDGYDEGDGAVLHWLGLIDWLDGQRVVLVHADLPMAGRKDEQRHYIEILDALGVPEHQHDCEAVFPPECRDAVEALRPQRPEYPPREAY